MQIEFYGATSGVTGSCHILRANGHMVLLDCGLIQGKRETEAKNREPFLDEAIRPRVHGYLATAIRDLDSPWVVVGGVADHIHILFDMGKMVAPVKFVEQDEYGLRPMGLLRHLGPGALPQATVNMAFGHQSRRSNLR